MKRLLLLALTLLPLGLRADGWRIEAHDRTHYAPVAVANGELGAVVGAEPFEIGPIVVGSSYERGTAEGVSRILSGINPLGITLLCDGVAGRTTAWSQELDLRRALHTTRFSTPDAEVTYAVRALRNLPHALLMQVQIRALRDGVFDLRNRHRFPANLTDTLTANRTVWCEEGGRRVQRSSASYNGGASRIAATSVLLGDARCEQPAADRLTVRLRRGETARFALLGVVCTTDSFSDVWNESERQAIYAVREGIDRLIAAHEARWNELWQGDIEIDGDPEAQQAVRLALYNLYGSVREGSRRSIAPMGLTSQGYNGHIFWDAEMWMLPPLLVLHPELAREMLAYRFDRLAAARRHAAAYGYRGAMFPWESDDRGEECTPTFALTGPLEHHITADVAIAAWNYYCVTQDRRWLRDEGWPLLRACAEFWSSRVSRNDDGSYSICNVVGADEYAIGVDDNAFTNGAARLALAHATQAARLCGEEPDPAWAQVAAGLRICRFADGTTREHAAYNGEQIKQADANLLGYPLGLTDRATQLRDLAYYLDRIDPENGPAMSHSLFAVQYARAGRAEEACAMFRRAYRPYWRPPFGAFSETAASNNPYFVTGAGGLLQAVIFGFGGMELTDEGIVRHASVLPPGWKRLTIKTPNNQ